MDLNVQVQKAFRRLEKLSLCESPSQELTSKLLSELNSALHELQTTTAELLEQNEEILANRQTLEDARHRYQDLFDFAPEGYMVTDMEGIILDANIAATNLFNVSRSFLIGKPLAIFVRKEDHLSFRIGLQELKQRTTVQKDNWELIMLSRMETTFPVSIKVGKVIASKAKTMELRWILRDITLRSQMEEEKEKQTNSLRENEKRFRTCFDSMLDCINIYTAVRDEFGIITDFLIDYTNESACLDRKMTKEELVGRSYLELFHNYIKTEFFYKYCQVVETGEPLIVDSFNYKNTFHKHIEGVYDYRAFKFEDGIVLSWRNITKQKKMEQEIIRLDQLNLVGEMAAGIGHEVRNPMTTVRGFLQLLSNKGECSRYNNYFTLMIEELDRANSIITEFLCVAKDKVAKFEMQSLKKVVENILPLIQSDATVSDKYIHVELEEVREIPLDKKEIHQLIINLAQNGLEAISPGGTLMLKTFVEKDEIVLLVQDNGKGISEEVLNKIGSPFFSTKENGTGLGLAVCYSIAARHNAKINIETGATGTSFFVRFKKTDQKIT